MAGPFARDALMDLSQEEPAAPWDLDRTCIDRTYISEIERGTRNPMVQTLWLIAQRRGVAPQKRIAATETEIASATPGA